MLTAKGGATPPDAPVNEEGKQLDYAAKAVPGRPNWIAVIPTLAIECGSDSMVMLFERGRQGWHEMISRRSKPYRSISDAWEGLEYAVSPPDDKGRWYLAIASTTPWCMSVWRGLRYDLSRAGQRGAGPHIFFSTTVGTNIGGDGDGDSIHAGARVFEIRHDGATFAIGLTRKHIERYAVAGDSVRRIQPVALSPGDFVHEWLARPWAEAASWSATGAGLKTAHARLRPVLFTLSATRPCGSDRHQVKLDPDSGAPWYALVDGTATFRLRAISTQPSRACR